MMNISPVLDADGGQFWYAIGPVGRSKIAAGDLGVLQSVEKYLMVRPSLATPQALGAHLDVWLRYSRLVNPSSTAGPAFDYTQAIADFETALADDFARVDEQFAAVHTNINDAPGLSGTITLDPKE